MEGVRRLGLNLGQDDPFAGAALTRERLRNPGFEGVLFRQCTYGPGGDRDSFYDSFPAGTWKDLFPGARATFLTGPRRGEELAVVGVGREIHPDPQGEKMLMRHDFATAGPAPAPFDGLLVEPRVEETGWVGQHGGDWWVFAPPGARVSTRPGLGRPGSQGHVALELAAAKEAAGILAPALHTDHDPVAGVWRLGFWARSLGEEAALTAYVGDMTHRGADGFARARVELGPAWRYVESEFDLDGYPHAWLGVGFRLESGRALLDDATFAPASGGGGAFRPVVAKVLREFAPGVLRLHQVGGSSLENHLAPRPGRKAYSFSRFLEVPGRAWPGYPDSAGRALTHAYGLHEFLELCRDIEAEPWYCTPGTFTPDEMRDLVEYLAGPVTTPYGALRAERGRVRPWTEAFGAVHLEIGNEAWNHVPPFLNGGYCVKPDYWRELFAAGAASRHWTPAIRFHAGGQAVNHHLNAGLARGVDTAHALALAPYLVHEIPARARDLDEAALFAALFATARDQGREMMRPNTVLARESGKEVSVYEVNWHATRARDTDRGDVAASAAAANRIAVSAGGGVVMADWMLSLLADHGVRVQNFFTLAQFDTDTPMGRVRLWGGVLDFARRRYRPVFQALALCNRAVGSRLLKVETDANPVLGHAPLEGGRLLTYPALAVHGFARGSRDARGPREARGQGRGLVLINRDTATPLTAVCELGPDSGPQGVRHSWLEFPRPGADNEPGHEPRVRIRSRELEASQGRVSVTLNPCGLAVLTWEAP